MTTHRTHSSSFGVNCHHVLLAYVIRNTITKHPNFCISRNFCLLVRQNHGNNKMSGKSLLDETKTILKSLVVSSSEALTTDQLNRDYKDRIGKDIPFYLLGYADLKSFLRSIPDVLTLDVHFVRPSEYAGNSSVSNKTF